jgi:DNA-binding beta-propeller fold protein YncE
LEPGAKQQFAVKMTTGACEVSGAAGSAAPAIILPVVESWSANGIPGGSPEFGAITSDGLYTAPARIPAVNEICITAALRGQPKRYLWATVLLGPGEPKYSLAARWGEEGKGPGQFAEPHGICLDAEGNVLVTDGPNNKVYRFTHEGKLMGELAGASPFDSPRDVTVDAAGNIFVVDSPAARVQKFDSKGQLILSWGEKGSEPGQFQHAHAIIAAPNGRIYAAEVNNCRIQVYDSSGKFLLQWGERGTGPGQFTAPFGVAADPNGDIFVCEFDGHRCQKFTADGVHLVTFAVAPADKRLNYHALTCDRRGNVYVMMWDNAAKLAWVAKYNNQGDSITTFIPPLKPGQTFKPTCAAVDEQGRVYVTDRGTGSVGIAVFAPGEEASKPLAIAIY